MTDVTEGARDQTLKSRSGKQKLQILPALGKLLILAARYDEKDEEGKFEIKSIDRLNFEKFQNVHFQAQIVIFEGKVIKMITRVYSWISTNSPYI